ncbi:MAG: glycosyltransferase family 4 protein [Oscillospiraceae bacterium]
MKKFLIVAHYSRFLIQFELNDARILQSMGYEVHYACNYRQEDMYENAKQLIEDNAIILHQIDFSRSPFTIFKHWKVYQQLVFLMQTQKFDGVHCHTPIASVLTRLASHKTNTTPVLYTAHGFHFFKGCPIQNQLLYKTAERWMARYTDALITMNHEDYISAQTLPLRGKAYYIPGVGVDTKGIAALQVDRADKRKQLGIAPDDFVFISVGELIKRKNHETAIRAFAKAQISHAVYVICGSGILQEELCCLIKDLNIEEKIKFIGFRIDAKEIIKAADICVFPSYQEGMPMALMEAMAAGLPCIVSEIRGNVDLIEDGKGGYLCDAAMSGDFVKAMQTLAQHREICETMGAWNLEKIKQFDISKVSESMTRIYNEQL